MAATLAVSQAAAAAVAKHSAAPTRARRVQAVARPHTAPAAPVRAPARAPLQLHSTAVPAFLVAAGSSGGGLRGALQPIADSLAALNLPEPLVHWGHPGNMAVVLFAMGGYGSYLGWQLRNPEASSELKAKARDLHPKLLGGMFFFFTLGAGGGVLSLVMQGKPILESPHATTGLIGLGLLAFQAMLPAFFQEDASLRTAHAYLGSAIGALFLVHAAFGLQLGLSI